MKPKSGWARNLLLLLVLTSGEAAAQEPDGSVLRWGEVRIGVGALYQHLDSRFAAGGSEPLEGPVGDPLRAAEFAPLLPLEQSLDAFFAEIDPEHGFGAAIHALSAGTLIEEFAWSTRWLPVEIAVGALPRVEFGLSLPIMRGERLTRRAALAGGTVGLNPDPIGNRALLEPLGAIGIALGGGTLLPLADSELGRALQQELESRLGEGLALPQAPLDGSEAVEGEPPLALPHLVTEWLPGDLEIGARFLLLSTIEDPAPASGWRVRTTLLGSLTLPTGRTSQIALAPQWMPVVGIRGGGVGMIADLLIGDDFWLTSGARIGRYRSDREVDAQEFTTGTAFTGLAHVPGNELEFWALPRLRLAPELSLGAGFRSLLWSGASTPPARTGALHELHLALRYSTLPAIEARGSGIPVTFAAGYRHAVAGSNGIPAPRSAYIQAEVIPRFGAGQRAYR